jgi:hypothetical protein
MIDVKSEMQGKAMALEQVDPTPEYSGTTAGQTASVNRRPIRYGAALLFGKYGVLKKFNLLPEGQRMCSNRVLKRLNDQRQQKKCAEDRNEKVTATDKQVPDIRGYMLCILKGLRLSTAGG